MIGQHDYLVKRVLSVASKCFSRVYAEGKNGVGKIEVFDTPVLPPGLESTHHMADADVLVLDANGSPLLIAEPETAETPKSYSRSILPHSLARLIRVNFKNPKEPPISLPVSSPLLLLIVIPDTPTGQTPGQLARFRAGVRQNVQLHPWPGSSLLDFDLCQDSGLEQAMEDLVVGNGLGKPGRHFA